MTFIFEGFFLVYTLLQFFVDNTPVYQDSSSEMQTFGSNKKKYKTLLEVGKEYLVGNFIWDLIPLLPF